MALYETQKEKHYLLIKSPRVLDKAAAEAFAKEYKKWLLEPVKVFVFDFKGVLTFSPEFLRQLSALNKILKNNEKKLYSLNINPTKKLEFREKGMLNVFSPIDDIEEIFNNKQGKIKVDSEFLSPFIQGTSLAFGEQMGVEVKPQKPYLKKGNNMPDFDIAGIISMNSDDFVGTIGICFAKETFCKLYEQMVGEEVAEIDEEVQDAASEVLNIIYGYAKTSLIDKGKQVNRAIPTVLVGDKLRLSFGSSFPTIFFPFDSSIGTFHLVFNIENVQI